MVNVCVLSQDIMDMDGDMAMAMEAIMAEAMEVDHGPCIMYRIMVDKTDMIQKCTYIHNYV